MMDKIYPGSTVSVLSGYCLLMEFKRLCKVSFSTMVVLLNLLQLLCPANNLLPTTKYQLLKFVKKSTSLHSKIDFCRSCSAVIKKEENVPLNSVLKLNQIQWSLFRLYNHFGTQYQVNTIIIIAIIIIKCTY